MNNIQKKQPIEISLLSGAQGVQPLSESVTQGNHSAPRAQRERSNSEHLLAMQNQIEKNERDCDLSNQLNNRGVDCATQRNYEKAFELYLEAVQTFPRNSIAQSNLAICYFNGRGTPQNYEAAFRCFQAAVESVSYNCNYLARNDLGVCYLYGYGVERSYEKAFFYFKLAENHEYTDSRILSNLGNCYYYGEGVEKDLNLATEYFERTIKANPRNSEAHCMLGICYFNSQNPDYEAAFNCFKNAENIEPSDQRVFCNLGICYYHGKGVEKDLTIAIKYLEKAIKLNPKNTKARILLEQAQKEVSADQSAS